MLMPDAKMNERYLACQDEDERSCDVRASFELTFSRLFWTLDRPMHMITEDLIHLLFLTNTDAKDGLLANLN